MSFLDSDPTKPVEELLINVRNAGTQHRIPGLLGLPIATLLVRLTSDVTKTVEELRSLMSELDARNERLQKALLWLTVATVVSSVVQICIAVYSIPNTSSATQSAPLAPPPQASSAR